MLKRLIAVAFVVALFLGLNPRLSYAISFADYVYQSVKTGHISAVRQYMRQGYNINAVNSEGMSALCTAAYNRDFVTYNRLVRLGASENVDCLQKVDVAEMKTTEKQYVVRSNQQQNTTYVRRTSAAPVAKSAKVSGSSNMGTYIGLGALAAGGIAAVALSGGGGGGSHHGGDTPGKTCPTGQHLVDGECVPIECPEGTVLIGNDCVVPYQCMDGEYWNGSECVRMECPAGTHLVGSECVENDTCPSGQHMVDGECVDIVCGEGYQLVGEGCVKIGECPIGQYKAGDVCVDIICPENTHLVGNSCVADDIHIVKEDDTTLIGIGSNARNVFNLRSVPVYPDSISSIDLDNTGNGDVYGIYGYSGEVFNSFVAAYDEEGNTNKKPVGIGTITIKDNGSGTVYGMYSHIADVTQYKEAVNAYSLYNGTAYGNIEIEHTGGGVTYGLLGDVRAYNTYASMGGNSYGDITIRGDGDMYGIYGYVAATNGLIFWYGNRAEANINLVSEGDGNVYGMAISKDDIPGAGSGGQAKASWFAFNAYADNGSVDGKIDIYKKNGSGNVYGMYGGRELYNAMSYGTMYAGKPTARSRGVISIFNAGHDNQAYGMYLPDEDEKAVIYNLDENNSESIIDIVNYSNGVATGMRGGKKASIINSGTININNMRDGTAVGIYGESGSSIENKGLIKIERKNDSYSIDGEKIDYVVDSAIGGSAYGIYAESGATVKNSGFVVVSGAENGTGIYLEKGATLENTGTVQFDGTYGSIVENGDVIDIYNQGRTNSLSSVELSSMGGGEIILGQGGRFFAESLSGDMSVSEKSVLGSFDDQYVISQALQVADITSLNTVSKSAMFEASKVSNSSGGYDVVMNRKSFDTLLDDKSIAEFLEYNYTNGNNLELYDNLKQASTSAALSSLSNSLTGKDVLPGFRRENSLVYNHLSRQFNESLFNKPDEHYLGGYKYIDISRDKDSVLGGNDGTAHSAYGMVKGKADNGITYGFGATLTQLDSDYDNHSSRKSNILGLWVPAGYDFNRNTKWFSKFYAGYEDGSYDRVTSFGKFSSDIKSYQYGLTNEIRHNIDLNGGIKLTPAAELNLLGIYQKGFDEGHKVNAIRTDDENMLSLEGGLGAYLSKEFNFDKDNSLSIQIGGIYYVEFLDPDKDIDAKMQGMDKKYKLSHKANSDHAVLSARVGYSYKNMTLYGQIEQETGSAKALTIDAGLQYNL